VSAHLPVILKIGVKEGAADRRGVRLIGGNAIKPAAAGAGPGRVDRRGGGTSARSSPSCSPSSTADEQLPLYRLLDRIADEGLDPRYRDVLSIAVLPYLHARLPATLTAKPPYLMTDDELRETLAAQERHEQEVAKGRCHLHVIKRPE
jgi:hypothetical protein